MKEFGRNRYRKNHPNFGFIVCVICGRKDKRTGALQKVCVVCRPAYLKVYTSVLNHRRYIKNGDGSYKGMPFHKAWGKRPFLAPAQIIKDIGAASNKNFSLDVIDHVKGFVPGNLQWSEPKGQSFNKMAKKVSRLRKQLTDAGLIPVC
jgi:hypothetical protein